MHRNMLLVVVLSAVTFGCASSGGSVQTPLASDASDAPSVVLEPEVDIVTAEELMVDVDAPPDGDPVTCRQMLQQASNVIVQRCMSESDWRIYRRAEEEWARRLLRQIQGGAY